MKTEQQIKEQIEKLEAVKPRLRVKASGFGESHIDAINAQIDVLKNKLDYDKACDNYSPEVDLDDDTRSESVYDAVVSAVNWLYDDGPDLVDGDGWESLT